MTPGKWHYLVHEYNQSFRDSYYPTAIVCSTIANRHRGKRERRYKAEDFMPDFDSNKPQAQSSEDMLTLWKHVIMPKQNAIAKAQEAHGNNRR